MTQRNMSICNAVGSTKNYIFDEDGLLSESENARGLQMAYAYDAVRRMVKIIDELRTSEYKEEYLVNSNAELT